MVFRAKVRTLYPKSVESEILLFNQFYFSLNTSNALLTKETGVSAPAEFLIGCKLACFYQ